MLQTSTINLWTLHNFVAAHHPGMMNVVGVIPASPGEGDNFSDYNLIIMSTACPSGYMVLSFTRY